MKYSPTGVVYTRGPGTYKIPSADDVPREFNVKLLKNSSNPNAIFSSKVSNIYIRHYVRSKSTIKINLA